MPDLVYVAVFFCLVIPFAIFFQRLYFLNIRGTFFLIKIFCRFYIFYIVFILKKIFKNGEFDTHGCFVAGERDCVGRSVWTL